MSTFISSERDLEQQFIEKLSSLKYEYRPDICDRASLEQNFRERFQTLNHVSLTDSEFSRLLEEVITPDVFTAAKTLRQITSFTRDDGTPLNYTLGNIKDWCKNRFEVVNQLRMNTDYSHHRYDVILLINGVPVVQVELKTLGVNPRRAMEQIVEYKNDPGTSGIGLVSQMEKFGRIIAGSSYANYLLLKKNDFAYNKSATKEYPEGFIALYADDELAAVPNSIFTCFRIKGDSPDPQYLNYLFLGNLHGQWLRKFIEVGARAHGSLSINENDLLALPVPLPSGKASLFEQQKIADCLSSVDELIGAESRKLDALKNHKKGLMQQLFPQEGETQSRLRFPEFRNDGEWEPKLLGDVVKSFKTGKLDANAMVENGKYRFYTCAKNYYQIDTYAFEGEALLVAGNGAHLGYIHHYIGKFNAYQRTYVLQNFEANAVFLRCLLDRYLPSRIQLEKKDGNTPYIVLSTLTEMPLVIPKSPDEQQRIADCLSSLDDLIVAQTQKIEAIKTHKKGLMQQLFPSEEHN